MADNNVSVSFTGVDDGFSAIADRVVAKTGEVGSAAETASEQASTGAASVGQSFEGAGERVAQTGQQFERVGQAGQDAGDHIAEGAEHGLVSLEQIEAMTERLGIRLGELFTIHTVIDFGKDVLETAESFEVLANKTGLSIEYVEQLKPVADLAGSSVDAFAQAAYRLGVNIQDGSEKSVNGLNTLAVATGNQALAWQNIKDVDAQTAFQLVTSALSDMDDQTRANALGQAIFGRQFQDLAAAVHDGSLKMATDAKVASDAQVEAAANAEKALKRVWDDGLNSAVTHLGTFAAGVQAASTDQDHLALSASAALGPLGELVNMLALYKRGKAEVAAADADKPKEGVPLDDETERIQQAQQLRSAIDLLDQSLQNNDHVLQSLTAAERAHMDVEISDGATAKQLVDVYGITEISATKLIDAHKKATEAEQKHAAAMASIAEATGLYQMAIDDLVPAQQQIAADLTEHILSEDQIAKKYDVSATAVKAVSEAEKERAAQAKAAWESLKNDLGQEGAAMLARIENEDKLATAEYQRYAQEQANIKSEIDLYAAGRKQIEKADADLADARQSIDATTYQREKATLEKWQTDQLASYRGTADQYNQFADTISDTFETKIASLGPEWIADLGDIEKAFGSLSSSTIAGLQNIGKEATNAIGDFKEMGQGISQLSNADSWVGAISGAISFVGALSGAISVISSIASGIASLFGGSPGRDAVKDFAGQYGGFDALHSQLDQIPGGEDLWQQLSSVGSNDAAGAQAVITKIQTLFANWHSPIAGLPGTADDASEGGQQPGDTRIPHYATGGYIASPTVALVGDAAGGEFVTTQPQMAALLSAAARGGSADIVSALAEVRARLDRIVQQNDRLDRNIHTVLPKHISSAVILAR